MLWILTTVVRVSFEVVPHCTVVVFLLSNSDQNEKDAQSSSDTSTKDAEDSSSDDDNSAKLLEFPAMEEGFDDGSVDNGEVDLEPSQPQPAPFPEQLNALPNDLLNNYTLPSDPPSFAPEITQ